METEAGAEPEGGGEPPGSSRPAGADPHPPRSAPASSSTDPSGTIPGPPPDPDEPPELDDLVPAAASGAADRPRRTIGILAVAVVAFLVLVGGVVVLASRGQSVVTSVEAAEAIPATTLPPLEVTTTTEAAPAAEEPPPTDPTPSTTAPPIKSQSQQSVNITLTRPSTVLKGATVGQIPVFTSPGGPTKLTLPNPRAINGDPNASAPLILLQKQAQGDWIEAYLPVRPNGSTGWVRRSDFTTSTHDYVIEVRLSQFNLKVFNGNNVIMNTAIGVATDNAPTPGGLYYTIELLAPPDPSGPYGPYAYGLSGYSNVYQSFGGGPGQLGLHGTNQPGAIGRKVSHGCIRLSNNDITTLAKSLPLGVPVAVYP